jgi:hypothetical protein
MVLSFLGAFHQFSTKKFSTKKSALFLKASIMIRFCNKKSALFRQLFRRKYLITALTPVAVVAALCTFNPLR